MDQSSEDELSVQVPSNKSTVDPLRKHECSPLLKLPGELRNMIFRYAFQEPCIFVRRNGLGEIKFVVEPEDFPTTPRYPLRDLLDRTAICCELYAEVKHLPIHINTFHVHCIHSVKLCIDRILTAVRAKAKCITLGLTVTELFLYDLVDAGMNKLDGLERIVVDIDFHLLAIRSHEEKNAKFHRTLNRNLIVFTRRGVDFVFE